METILCRSVWLPTTCGITARTPSRNISRSPPRQADESATRPKTPERWSPVRESSLGGSVPSGPKRSKKSTPTDPGSGRYPNQSPGQSAAHRHLVYLSEFLRREPRSSPRVERRSRVLRYRRDIGLGAPDPGPVALVNTTMLPRHARRNRKLLSFTFRKSLPQGGRTM